MPPDHRQQTQSLSAVDAKSLDRIHHTSPQKSTLTA
jgi:hypothetical protein